MPESEEQENGHLLSSQHHSKPINNFSREISDSPTHRKSTITLEEEKLFNLRPLRLILMLTLKMIMQIMVILLRNPKFLP